MKILALCGAVLLLGSTSQASVIDFLGTLNGSNEVPSVATSGTGSIFISMDNVANTITFDVTFSGLSSADTAAHIHCCVAPGGNAGVATTLPALAGFPLSVTSGSFTATFNLFDQAFYNPAFVTSNGGLNSAEAALVNGMIAGDSYFNIHTSTNPGGEIRALLVAKPEPGTFALGGLALGLLGAPLRRRRRGQAG
jgi:hypothetical protein